MADKLLRQDIAAATVIDDNATLASSARAAADYDNSTNKATHGDLYLTVQWNTTPPTTLDLVAELFLLKGDGSGLIADGGDAGLGTDDTPVAVHSLGHFQSLNPSITVDETMAIYDVELTSSSENRFVLLNTSGQEFDLTWILQIVPHHLQTAAV